MPQKRLRTSPLWEIGDLLGFRGRRILHTGAWSLVAKLCAAANLFVSVPYVVGALGFEQFGAWATLVSLITFAGFLDFGIGSGAMNLVAAAHGRKSPADVATILHASRNALIKIALMLAVIALIALPLIPWERMLGMPETMSAVSRTAVAIVLFSIVLAVPLNLANRVQLGLGRGDRAFRWQAAGQLATLAMVIWITRVHPSLPLLTAAAVTTPLLASLANTYSLWRDPTIKSSSPTPRADRAPIERQIRNEGGLFFILQLAAALAFSADLLLISTFLGTSDAGTYAIVQRLFSVIPLVLSLVWVPLWPIHRQALAAGDRQWVMRTLRYSLVLALMTSILGAAFLALGFDSIIALWVDSPVLVSGLLLAGFALWSIIEAAGTAVATFLNAASVLRFQVIIASVFAVTCFGGKAWVIANHSIEWIPLVTVVTYTFACVVPFVWFWRRIISAIFAKKY